MRAERRTCAGARLSHQLRLTHLARGRWHQGIPRPYPHAHGFGHRQHAQQILRRTVPLAHPAIARRFFARAHRASAQPASRATRERLSRCQAAHPLLFADDGTGHRHQGLERRQSAQRPAHAGELRAAQRSRRSQRAARFGVHLLLVRQPPRPILLQSIPS